VILRQLDALTEHALHTVGGFVEQLRAAGSPWIVATLCGEREGITAEQQR